VTGGRGGHELRIHLSLLTAQVGFAIFPVLGRVALAEIPALVAASIRVVTAALLFEAIRRFAGASRIAATDRPRVLLYALLGVSLNQVLFIIGLSMTSAINTAIMTASIPAFTLGVAVALGREKLSRRAALGVALAGAGALLLLDAARLQLGSSYLLGNFLLLLNCLSYAAYLVLSRPIASRYPIVSVVALLFRFGAVPIVLVSLPALLAFDYRVSGRAWASLAGIILLCTVIPYFLNFWALSHTDASKVALYVFLQPLVSTLLAILFLGERLTGRTLAAGALILAGLGVTAIGGRLLRRPVP
jgi:drug/metabolite transporter (DMT)-like permease